MILFWIVVGIIITGAILAVSLVTTSKAYDYKHKVDPPPSKEEEQPHQ
ncbi:YtzI protein [Bacillus swezeyi]|uniref:YtzI protein n=1 Tax=Bacillus swezeyi TaxID=1925020 RepID=A0A5M8RLW5_9BACI|nr:YtzI protein [Bacillus swezeyi]KAA6448498.1 YtzI protein [Bacillus swezeyi]KAA6481614.1 YtzI protein [Bacillus swezeyi]TYS34806.1 YtzI protein [Bacillus swezeyi]